MLKIGNSVQDTKNQGVLLTKKYEFDNILYIPMSYYTSLIGEMNTKSIIYTYHLSQHPRSYTKSIPIRQSVHLPRAGQIPCVTGSLI